jgi:6,7-dimethyl-8-ribityllumazine synthase
MLINGATSKLNKKKNYNYKIINVPGTFEIPVVISNLITKYDAFVVLGCVIKGKTPHFDYLCSSVFNSLINISVQSKKPIGNGILTCNNKKQAILRADPNKKNKGGDAATAIISLLDIIN